MADNDLAPVSVVIPCYRCTETIERAVSSVYSQTWRPAEVILVEDCSGDATLQNLISLARKYPEGWVQVIALSKNSGPGTARNVGWERAKQTYIAFLDADDTWHPQKIEIQACWMLEDQDVALTGHRCAPISLSKDSKFCSFDIDLVRFKPVSSGQLLFSNRFPTRSVMLKRALPHRFADGKYHSEDFLLWCEICLDGYRCCRSSAPLAFLYKAVYGEQGLSGDLHMAQRGQLATYRHLQNSNRINKLTWLFLVGWSWARYFKRIVITEIRKHA